MWYGRNASSTSALAQGSGGGRLAGSFRRCRFQNAVQYKLGIPPAKTETVNRFQNPAYKSFNPFPYLGKIYPIKPRPHPREIRVA